MFQTVRIKTYRWASELESEWFTHDFKTIHLHSEKVTEGRFWTSKQIESNMGLGVFTANFEYEYRLLKGEIF